MRVKTKLLTALVGMSVSAFAGVANAADVEHVINLSASVPSSCEITDTPTVVSGTAFSNVNQASSDFNIAIAGTNANPTSGELTIGTISCSSGQMEVTLTPNGWIKNTNTTIGGEITYTAKIVDDGTPVSGVIINSGTGTSPISAILPGSTSDVGVMISTDSVTGLGAGTYEGTLTLSIDPA